MIADTGIGMDPEFVEQAFVRFEKLHSEQADSYGLGLAIVRSIASFHNMTLAISSEKGNGTSIRVIFPS
ncbi:Bacteriophytochrome [compost metagenome]